MSREELLIMIVGFTLLAVITFAAGHYGILDQIDMTTLMMMAGSMQQ